MLIDDVFYFIAINYFFIIWLLPVAWMMLFSVRTSKLNFIFSKIYKAYIVFSLFAFLGLMKDIINIFNFMYNAYPTTFLMTFYFNLALAFTFYLINVKSWNFPQAISVSVICALIGSYYWEVPYLIYNALNIGFEFQWILHIMGVMFFWFIWKNVGWKKDTKTIGVVIFGFMLAFAFMYFGGFPKGHGENHYLIWNSAYYMTIRLICTLISMYAVNKSIPKELEKK